MFKVLQQHTCVRIYTCEMYVKFVSFGKRIGPSRPLERDVAYFSREDLRSLALDEGSPAADAFDVFRKLVLRVLARARLLKMHAAPAHAALSPGNLFRGNARL